jgi:hypothetical protein
MVAVFRSLAFAIKAMAGKPVSANRGQRTGYRGQMKSRRFLYFNLASVV